MTALQENGQSYEERLRTLSEASVHQHFDAFLDIDWDHPDFAIDPDDERWILPEADVLEGRRLAPRSGYRCRVLGHETTVISKVKHMGNATMTKV